MPLTATNNTMQDSNDLPGLTLLTIGSKDASFLEVKRVLLKGDILKNEKMIKQVPLQPLNCSFGVVKHEQDATVQLSKAVGRQLRDGASDVTVVFAVRRPGCGNCREHGQQLCDLAAIDKQVSLIGVVKETGVADQELVNFYQNYFRRPIFLDSKWKVFQAMGGKKLSFTKLLKGHLFGNQKRHKKKQIENVPFGGDLYTQGGLLFFDKRGTLRFAYDEVFGEELDMKAVNAAIHFTRMINEEEYSTTKSASGDLGRSSRHSSTSTTDNSINSL